MSTHETHVHHTLNLVALATPCGTWAHLGAADVVYRIPLLAHLAPPLCHYEPDISLPVLWQQHEGHVVLLHDISIGQTI